MRIFNKGQRGTKISFEGYSYRKHRSNLTNIEWKCIESDCGGSIKTPLNFNENTIPIEGRHHNHVSDVKMKFLLSKKESIKNIALNNMFCPTKQLIDDVLSGQSDDIILGLGTRLEVSKQVQMVRKLKYPTISKDINDLYVPRHMYFNIREELFYRYGPNNYNFHKNDKDVLVFYSDFGSNLLKNNDVWCVDGTFYVAPKPFYQMITISVIINHHVFPCVFILVKGKSQDIYLKVFNLINNMIPNLFPKKIISDFEIASINSLIAIWPCVNIQGCYFHYCQCLFRKIVENGFKKE